MRCMELLSLAGEYLRVENDEYDSEPESVGVGTVDYSEDFEFEISGRFPVEGVEEGYVLPPEKRVFVDEGSEMYTVVEEVFECVRENVVVSSGAEITSIHVGSVGSAEGMPDEWSFYTSSLADSRVFVGVEREGLQSGVRSELLELVVGGLSELDSEVVGGEVRTAEFLFSDTESGCLETVRGYVDTPRPYRYYDGVGSLTEYVDTLADDSDEAEEMYSEDVYEVFYRLDWVWDESASEYAFIEGVMDDMVSESLVVPEWEFIVEEEYICLGEFTDGLLSEGVKYYVHIPVTDGVIGVSR